MCADVEEWLVPCEKEERRDDTNYSRFGYIHLYIHIRMHYFEGECVGVCELTR